MRTRIGSHHVINITILVLVVLTLSLAGILAWGAYRERIVADQLVRANHLADRIIAVAADLAVERGLTAAALGTGRSGPTVHPQLATLRKGCDTAWWGIYSLAGRLAQELPESQSFAALLHKTAKMHDTLQDARRRVDIVLNTGRPAITAREWIAVISGFIATGARLREAAFAAISGTYAVAQLNNTLKDRAWLVSEYAGLERGVLAFYVAARQPVPTDILDELRSLRGVVQRNMDDILALRDLPGIDIRIAKAVEAMQREYLTQFTSAREEVYAATATGRYALSAEEWWDHATAAIASILGVVAAVTEIVEDAAQRTAGDNLQLLMIYLGLFGLTLGVGAVSFVLVHRTAGELFHQKDLAEVTLHSIGDAVITTDSQARVEYLNPIAEGLTGWTDAEARGRHIRDVFQVLNGVTREAEPTPVEICLAEQRIVGLGRNTVLARRDGHESVVEDSAAPVRDREGNIVGTVMVFYDVTQMRNAPHLLSYHATHDPVTGLFNRREFERRLSELLASARAEGARHALCYIDLDQFKVVNDTCGHVAGDKLLRQIAYLFRKQARDNDTLARIGGDEFALLLERCPLSQAERIADDLRRAVKDFHFTWEDQAFELGTSIGLVPISPDSASADEVLSEADAACYAAKEKGRNRVQVYEPGDAELARRHGEMQWVSRIRRAIEEGRFVLFAQTIEPADPDVHKERCCEILLRLLDEDGEIVPPMAFMPAAERYNLMPAIDRWVVGQALQIFAAHIRDTDVADRVHFNINLSGATLGELDLMEFIRRQIASHRVPADRICFEITETAAIANLDQAVNFIKTMRGIGCRFALDDFGTGMSSFSYLKNLPVNLLKIGGGFIRNVVANPVDRAMVDAINRIGHVMGIATVAESVENAEILAAVRSLDIDYAQGFGIDRPHPLADWLGRKQIGLV